MKMKKTYKDLDDEQLVYDAETTETFLQRVYKNGIMNDSVIELEENMKAAQDELLLRGVS